jgi:hypothetical protein
MDCWSCWKTRSSIVFTPLPHPCGDSFPTSFFIISWLNDKTLRVLPVTFYLVRTSYIRYWRRPISAEGARVPLHASQEFYDFPASGLTCMHERGGGGVVTRRERFKKGTRWHTSQAQWARKGEVERRFFFLFLLLRCLCGISSCG